MSDSKSELQRVPSSWLRGFYPIYQKELARWFGTGRWISQLIIWISLTALPAISLAASNQAGSVGRGVSVLSLFIWLGTIPMSIGTIVLAQGTDYYVGDILESCWHCNRAIALRFFWRSFLEF